MRKEFLINISKIKYCGAGSKTTPNHHIYECFDEIENIFFYIKVSQANKFFDEIEWATDMKFDYLSVISASKNGKIIDTAWPDLFGQLLWDNVKLHNDNTLNLYKKKYPEFFI